jgi:polyketide synthase PksM
LAREQSERRLHPLLHTNTSDLRELRFTSTFDGEEFFLRDHTIEGKRILPGSAYIEMARAAVCHMRPDEQGSDFIRLQAVTWSRPLVVESTSTVHIALSEGKSGRIGYEVYSSDPTEPSRRIVHAQGFGICEKQTRDLAPDRYLDLAGLQAAADRTIDVERCYSAIESAGIVYGPAHKGLQSLLAGRDAMGPFALAQVALPDVVRDSAADYFLHPSLLDCALQASIGLHAAASQLAPRVASGLEPSPGLRLVLEIPFSADTIEIRSRTPNRAVVCVRRSGQKSEPSNQNAYDIDVCDETGKLCVRVSGFRLRAVADPARQVAERPPSSGVLLTPRWEAVNVESEQTQSPLDEAVAIVGASDLQQRALLDRFPRARPLTLQPDDTADVLAARIRSWGSIDHLLWLTPVSSVEDVRDDSHISMQNAGVVFGFRLVKALLSCGYGERLLGFTVVTWQAQGADLRHRLEPTHASIHGFIGSLAKEYEHWRVRLVDLSVEDASHPERAFGVPAQPSGDAWAHRSGQWHRQFWLPTVMQPSEEPQYRMGGVYVVIGGAGGIGEAFSEYLIGRYQARLIWIGRRSANDSVRAQQRRLGQLGPMPHYIQADATERLQLQRALAQIRKLHGRVDGLVHAAVVLQDQALANMDEQRFREALAAKVDVSVRMAQVFADEPLDFVLFFSSLESAYRMPGQSNYAAGCTFVDAFAQRWARSSTCRIKIVNWGYWGSVGVVATPAHRARMDQSGIGSIEAPEAMAVLEGLLGSACGQLGWLSRSRADAQLPPATTATVRILPKRGSALALGNLRDKAVGIGERNLECLDESRAWRWAELNSVLVAALRDLLATPGVGPDENPTLSSGDDLLRSAALNRRERWMRATAHLLSHPRWIQEAPAVHSKSTLWQPRWGEESESDILAVAVRAASRALRQLPEVLSSGRHTAEVAFGDSLGDVARLYRETPVLDYCNEVLAELAAEYVREQFSGAPDRPVRVLEIGAGTGATTDRILEKLAGTSGQIVEYTFTDVSEALLLAAAERFRRNSFLTFRRLDIESPVAIQGIAVGGYDIVVAANALHTTRSVRCALRNAKAALRSGGILMLCELTETTPLAHVLFGLLEGWSRYEDHGLREPAGPALSPRQWSDVLDEEGFLQITSATPRAHAYGQQVIVAESDGIVSQADMDGIPEVAGDELSDGLLSRAVSTLKEVVGRTLRLAPDRILDDEPLESYGVDSIVVVRLAQSLREAFPELTSSAILGSRTVAALAAHLCEIARDRVVLWLGDRAPRSERQTEPHGAGSRRRRRARLRAVRQHPEKSSSIDAAQILRQFRRGELKIEDVERLLDPERAS